MPKPGSDSDAFAYRGKESRGGWLDQAELGRLPSCVFVRLRETLALHRELAHKVADEETAVGKTQRIVQEERGLPGLPNSASQNTLPIGAEPAGQILAVAAWKVIWASSTPSSQRLPSSVG